jgi:hypothetical protein
LHRFPFSFRKVSYMRVLSSDVGQKIHEARGASLSALRFGTIDG